MPAPVLTLGPCSCRRFKAQLAIRHWIGAKLARFLPDPVVGLPIPDTTTPQYYFRRFRLRIDPVRDWWTAGDFTVEWSTQRDTYGDFTVSGYLPTLLRPDLYSITYQIAGGATALSQITGPGAWVFDSNASSSRITTPAPFQLISSDLDADFIVTLNESVSGDFSGAYHFTVTREYSDWLRPEHVEGTATTRSGSMADILALDFDPEESPSPVPYSEAVIPVNYPELPPTNDALSASGGTGHFLAEEVARVRGGVIESEDDAALLRNRIESNIPDAHAGRRISPLYHFLHADNTQNTAFPAFALRSLIYRPGRHSVQEFTFTEAEQLDCDEIIVPCNSAFQTLGYRLDPLNPLQPLMPLANNHRWLWTESGRCGS